MDDPALQGPEGVVARQKLLDNGYKPEEVDDWQKSHMQEQFDSGMKPEDIDAYWGRKPDMSSVTSHVEQTFNSLPDGDKQRIAESPWEMFRAGLQTSAVEIPFGKPTILPPEHAGLGSKMLYSFGQAIGDTPAMIAGWMGGMSVGAAAGAGVAGASAGPEAAPAGAALGGLMGAGAGAAALPEAWRRIWMEHQANPEGYKNWSDFWASAATIMHETGKAALLGGISAPLGGLGGRAAEVAGAGKVLSGAADAVTMAGGATAVGAAMDGHVPTSDDIATGAALALGFHAIGTTFGATNRYVASQRATIVQQNLRDTYTVTGRNPMTIAQQATKDVALQGEVLGPTSADGTRIQPTIDSMKLPEPEPWVKPPAPEAAAAEESTAPQAEPEETSASAGVKNENGLTHEQQALIDTPISKMTDEQFQQHLKNATGEPAYLAHLNKIAAEHDAQFETQQSPVLELQGDTKEWLPPPAPHIEEPNLIEPLPAQPTDTQKANLHTDPVTRENVSWSESEKKWVAPDDMTKGDWQHLQALVEPKIGAANTEVTSWWHGSSVQDPSLDPANSAQKVSAVWVASSRFIAKNFAGDYKGTWTKNGSMTRVHVLPGKYFDFRDTSQHADFEQWLKDESGAHRLEHELRVESMKRGNYTTMENGLMQRFFKDRGYEGYFEREAPTTPVNLAVFDKAKLMKDESGPTPVQKQLLRLRSEQAEAENFSEPGTMMTAYGPGERVTPEEEAAVRKDIQTQQLTAASGGKPPGGEPPNNGAAGPHTPEGEPPKPITWQEARDKMVGLIAPDVKKGILPDWANPRKFLADFQSQLVGSARNVDMLLGSDQNKMTVEDQARQGYYASSGRLNQFFRMGTLRITDPKTWRIGVSSEGSLASAYKAVTEDGGNVIDFTSVRMALRTLEKAQQGIEIHPQLTPELALARMQEPGIMDKYQRGLQIMKKHKDGLVDYAQDASLFSPALAQSMKDLNKAHIYLKRVMDPDYSPAGVSGMGRVFNPMRKLTGGNKLFGDIVTGDFENAQAIVSMADRNLTRLNIIDHVTNPGNDGLRKLGYDFSRVEAKDLDRGVLLDGKMVDEEGAPIAPEHQEAMLPFLAERAFNENSENARRGNFLIFRNGQPEVWHTSNPDLAATLGAEMHGTPPAVFQLAIKMAGLERAGIVGGMPFMVRSLLHQQMASSVTGRGSPIPFLNFFRGIGDTFGHTDAFEEAQAHGIGGEGAMSLLDRDPLLRNVTDTFDKAGTWSSVMNMAKHPYDAWLAFSHRLHQASSVGGFKALKDQGFDPSKAAMIMRTDYLDHAEPLAASWANTFARMTPFMTTGIKDIEQLGRALQDRPVSTIMKGLVKLTLPTMALSYVNAEMDKTLPPGSRYTDLPEWRRLLFWNIPVAGIHIAIPKPYAVGAIFAGMPQMVMDNMMQSKPTTAMQIGRVISEQMLPPAIPTAVSPVLDQVTNSHFSTGVPLVPPSLAGVTNWMQYKPDTSLAARKVTQLMGPAGMGGPNISPIVLDNYIQSWAGPLPMAVFKALGAPWKDPGAPAFWADNPLFGSFIARNPGSHSQVVEDLFSKMHEFETAHASYKLAEKRMNEDEIASSRTAQTMLKIGVIRRSLERQMGAINAVNANKTMTDDDKTKRGDQMSEYLVRSAERSLVYLNRISK